MVEWCNQWDQGMDKLFLQRTKAVKKQTSTEKKLKLKKIRPYNWI